MLMDDTVRRDLTGTPMGIGRVVGRGVTEAIVCIGGARDLV